MLIFEGFLIVFLAGSLGVWNTIALIVLTSLVGAVLVRREGLSVLARVQQSFERGQIPTNELISGALLLVAAALIMTPGFFTAGIGLVLLFPPTRAVVREVLKRRFAARLATGGGFGGSRVRFTQWTDVRASEVTDTTNPSQPRSEGNGEDRKELP